MKLLLTGFLLLCLIWLPQQSVKSEDCQNILVYTASTDDGYRYYQLDVDQQTEVELQLPFDNLLMSAPVWSPDGNHIAIATLKDDKSGFDLSVLSDINAEPVQIASGYATGPRITWSPDSNWIAFESRFGTQIVAVSGEVYQQVTPPQDGYYYPEEWSPDGRYLAISSYDGQHSNLLIETPEAGTIREITPPQEGIFDYFVSWTPDSEGILYSTNRFSDNLSFYRLNLLDGESELYVDSYVVSVSWNPSRTCFVYAVSNKGFIEIYTRNLLTGEEILLTEGSIILHENYTRPVWSPDGSLIAFEAIDKNTDEYNTVVFMLNLDTNAITRLTSDARSEFAPYWIPCQS